MIRAATLADVRTISDIRTRSWQFIYRGRLPDAYLDAMDARQSDERWRVMIDGTTPRSGILVEDADGIAGFIALEPAAERNFGYEAYLSALYLEPERIGRGLGSALFDAGRKWLREAGYADVFWWVIAVNPYAVPFYERMGGRRVGVRTFTTAGEDFDEYAYGLDLGMRQ